MLALSYKMMTNPARYPEKGIICVVDDELPNLKALIRLLRAVGLETMPFDKPRLFLEHVKDHSVSLAIIDLRKPELSGLEVQRRLDDIAPEVAVIISTGDESAADRKVALVQGALAVLPRPILGNELHAVRKAIQLEPCPFCGQTLLEVRELNGLRYAEIVPVPSETNPWFIGCSAVRTMVVVQSPTTSARLAYSGIGGHQKKDDSAGNERKPKKLRHA
jgi:CheY-like chemotaxis protein